MTRRWTPWAVIVEASKYETRSQFRKADSYAYTMAVKLDLLNSLFPRTNTLASAIALALEVNDSAQLRKRYPAAARMLHRNGYTNLGVKREHYDRGSSLEETIALEIAANYYIEAEEGEDLRDAVLDYLNNNTTVVDDDCDGSILYVSAF